MLLNWSITKTLSALFTYGLFTALGAVIGLIGLYQTLDSFQDQFTSSNMDTFDFVIVGAGSAGSVLANRLSKNYKVLVLEAGGEPNPLNSIPILSMFLLNIPSTDWQYLTTPQKKSCMAMRNHQCVWPRGKSLGGSSNLNFLIYMRGHPNDFNHWANVTGDPRWTYENVLPYFKKSEDYHGEWDNERFHSFGGEIHVAQPPYVGMAEMLCKAGEEFGYPRTDLNAEFTEGFSPIYNTQKNGKRVGSYEAFIAPVRDRANLFIYKFSHVTEILLEGKNNRAVGVKYLRHGQTKIAHATKEVIISAGAMNSPQLLMLSGIGPKEHLESLKIPLKIDSPVGKNLQDHVSTLVGPFIVNDSISIRLDRDFNPTAIFDYLGTGTGPFATTAVEASGFFVSKVAKARGQADWPDIQYLLLAAAVHEELENVYARSHAILPRVYTFYRKAYGKDTFNIVNMLGRPLSRGSVKLRDKDPFSPPLLDANYFENESDIKVLVEGAKRIVDLIENSKTFRAVDARLFNVSFPGCENHVFRSDSYWECLHRQLSVTMYHQSGTCAMGKSDSPDAVVDSQLRVIGAKNLRVIDASVMPTVTSGNTNAPTVMIAEMGSQMILDHWAKNKECFSQQKHVWKETFCTANFLDEMIWNEKFCKLKEL